MLSDLRESGAIEQDADLVCFVFREEFYKPEKEEVRGHAEIIVGKHRNGPVGRVHLAFVGELARFENFTDGPTDRGGAAVLEAFGGGGGGGGDSRVALGVGGGAPDDDAREAWNRTLAGVTESRTRVPARLLLRYLRW